jgi:hypothetical protein
VAQSGGAVVSHRTAALLMMDQAKLDHTLFSSQNVPQRGVLLLSGERLWVAKVL